MKNIFYKSITRVNKYFSLVIIAIVSSLTIISCGDSDHSEGNIHLEVEFENAENQTVYLQLLKSNDAVTLDTLLLDENGKGSLKFEGDQISFYSLVFEGKEGEARFIADKDDKIKLKGDVDELFVTLKSEGNKSAELLNEFHDILLDYNSFLDSLKSEYKTLQEKNLHYGKEEEFNQLYIKKSIALENSVKKFIDDNVGEFITILAIRSLNPKDNLSYYQKVNSSLKEKYPESHYVQFFDLELKKMAALVVGGEAPDFTLPSFEGKDVKLSDFRGKYVLIDFWATWCKPCIAEIPFLKQAKERFGPKGFEIVSVCIDRMDTKPRWTKLIEDHQTNWPQLFDGMGETSEMYDIKAFPTLILLNPEGEVITTSVDQNSGFRREGMLQQLEQIIK